MATKDMFGFSFRLSGDRELRQALRIIEREMGTRGLERALRYAGRPIVTAARRNLDAQGAVDTGALRRSLGFYLRRNRRNREPYLIIGARHGKQFTVNGPDGKARVPANYAHLVEYGHLIASPGSKLRKGEGQVLGFVLPKPFLRPAFEQQRGPARQRLINYLAYEQARAARLALRRSRAALRLAA